MYSKTYRQLILLIDSNLSLVILGHLQIIVFLYDVLSYPIYRFLDRALSQVT